MVRWSIGIRLTETRSTISLTGLSGSSQEAIQELVEESRNFIESRAGKVGIPSIIYIDEIRIESADVGDLNKTVEDVVESISSALEDFEDRHRAATTRPVVSGPKTPEIIDRSRAPGPVSDSLNRIGSWLLASNVRHVQLPGATSEQIVRAEESTGTVWPESLKQFFRNSYYDLAQLLPEHDLLPLDRAMEIRSIWINIMSDLRQQHPDHPELDPREYRSSPAGTPSDVYLDEFIPFGDRDGSTLFIDTRVGERSGCVAEYSSGGANYGGFLWPSLDWMFFELATSLELGTPFMQHHPALTKGKIEWRR